LWSRRRSEGVLSKIFEGYGSKKSERGGGCEGRYNPYGLPLVCTQFKTRCTVGRRDEGDHHSGISVRKDRNGKD
jgi:hypothetical protein